MRISNLHTWERHVESIKTVIIAALTLLRDDCPTYSNEEELNRCFYFCLLRAIRREAERGNYIFTCPIPESRNPPYHDDKRRAQREEKRPDFVWSMIDHEADDASASARHFVIECKRLGKPLNPSWQFNRNYVGYGIRRFVLENYGYAKGEGQAGMVGYIESMKPQKIFSEVNSACEEFAIPTIDFGGTWQVKSVSSLDQQITRNFPRSPLFIQHLWLDLRNCRDGAI